MVRVAKNTDPRKLVELKQKIDDRLYMESAIKRIAATLTEELINMNEDKSGIKFQQQ